MKAFKSIFSWYRLLPLCVLVLAFYAIPAARGQSCCVGQTVILYSDTGPNETQIDVEGTVALEGNQSEILGWVDVQLIDYGATEPFDYIGDMAQLMDMGNTVDESGWSTGTYEVMNEAAAATNIGDTYTLIGWTEGCFVSGGEGGGDCEWTPLGTVQFSLTAGAPSISSITPASATVGAQPTAITVNGSNLMDAFGDSSVSITGGVNASFGPSETAEQATVNYSTLTSSNVGQQTLTISNSFGTSNGKTFTVGYPPATVSNVVPSTWAAGSTNLQVQITGQNFGTQPTLTLTAPGVALQPGYTTTPNGQYQTINATVNVAANAPGGPVNISVQPGYAGSGFMCNCPQGGSPDGTSTAQVVFTPPLPTIGLQNGTTTSPFAGQLISLSVSPPQGSNLTLASETWTIGNANDVVGGYSPSTASGSVTPISATNQANLSFYYIVPGASETVSVSVTYNLAGGSVSTSSPAATQTFTVGGPTGYSSSSGVAVGMGQVIPMSDLTLGLTNYPTPTQYAGIRFQALGSLPSGSPGAYSWIQTLSNQGLQIVDVAPGGSGRCTLYDSNNNLLVFPTLDQSLPYSFTATTSVSNDTAMDTPKAPTSSFGEVSETFNATMYLMWTPNSATGCSQQGNTACAIQVPLGSIPWNFCFDAINTLTPTYPQYQIGGGIADASTWALQQCTNPLSVGAEQPTFSPGSAYPRWSSLRNKTSGVTCP